MSWTGCGDEPDIPPTVCMTHRAFVPCRREPPCEISTSVDDVRRVNDYQRGLIEWEDV